MAMTKAADLSNSALTKYSDQYLDLSIKYNEYWGQFVDWEPPIADDGGYGKTWDFPTWRGLDPIETALTEDADVTPQAIDDYNTTVSAYEYGNSCARTQLLAFQSRIKTQQRMAELVANNRRESVDRIIRRAACGRGSSYPTQTYHIDASTTMASLTSTDTITWAFLCELVTRARSQGIEPMDGENFVAPIHPLLHYDLQQLNEWKNPGYYVTPDKNLYRGEVGMMAGIRFVVTPQARLHLAAGTVLQSATTTTAGINKDATTVPVTEQTGLAAGSYVAIGTVETESVNPGDDLEVVLVTAAAGSSGAGNLTVRGIGNGTSFGCRYDHAIGAAITEAYNVASIPVLGKESLKGIYGARTGRYGEAIFKDGLDLLNRFAYFGWYWYGGVARVEKNMILGRCAVSKWVIGTN